MAHGVECTRARQLLDDRPRGEIAENFSRPTSHLWAAKFTKMGESLPWTPCKIWRGWHCHWRRNP